MKKILLISITNEISPSVRYRAKYILDILESENIIQYDTMYFYSDNTMKAMNRKGILKKILLVFIDFIRIYLKIFRNKKNYDYLFIKTYILPFGGKKIEKFVIKRLKFKHIIFDIDDAVYLNNTRKQNKKLKKFRNVEEKINFWCKKADKIIVSNSIIKKDLDRYFNDKNCTIIEYLTCPYYNQYFNNKYEMIEAKKSVNMRFIWLGSPHTQNNLTEISDLIYTLDKTIKNLEIFILGTSDEFNLFKNIKSIKFVKWSIDNEIKYMRISHFGLNPLVNDKFETRKSAFKVIQYYRAGIYPIVSDVGINKNIISKFGGSMFDEIDIDKLKNIFENYEVCSNEIFERTKELTVEFNKEKFLNEVIDE